MDLLWTDFVNSEWHDWRGSGRSEDRLDRPGWLVQFLADHGLAGSTPGAPGQVQGPGAPGVAEPTPGAPCPADPAPADLAALKAFRTMLHGMAAVLAAGGAPDPADLAELNRVLAGGPVIRQIASTDAGHRLGLIPAGEGWAQVMAEVAASFAQTLTAGEGARVRICQNPDCRWVFYDDTRNRTKRFCDDKLCGNLMKVRRFRARQKT